MAAIGDSNMVYLFNAIGIRTFSLKDPADVEKVIFQLETQKTKIIFLSEDIYTKVPEVIEKYKTSLFPILIPIPIKAESREIGLKKIQENVEKAIGFNIF